MDSKNQLNFYRYIVIALLLIIVGGVLAILWGKPNIISAAPASISGEIDFNGLKPDPTDATNPSGHLKLKYRKYNSDDEYKDTEVPVSVADQESWIWDKAQNGTTYELIAELYYEDILIVKSNKATATAPATDVIIVFNVTQEDMQKAADELVKKLNITPKADAAEPTSAPAPTAAPELATISGNYTINGYIPSGSTIRAYGRRADDPDAKFAELRRDVPANKNDSFSYDQAYAGATYEYQAELYDANGQFIGESPYIKVTAPASNENVIINSTAQPPVQKAVIAGNIKVNGAVKQNSTILLMQRKHTTDEYKEIKRFDANKSIDFRWTDAVAGRMYDITAVLQVNEQNTATGNVITIAAPASDIHLQIDTNFNLSSPGDKPRLSCGDRDGTNHFNVKLELPQIDGAAKYHLEVGTSAGTNNVFNEQVSPNETKTIYIQADSPHFARYSYTACNNCDKSDSTNWSGWSPTLGFQCP